MSAATTITEPVFRRCSCGREYTHAEWLSLRDRGVQHVPEFGDEPAYALRLRDCVCGSTMGVETVDEASGVRRD